MRARAASGTMVIMATAAGRGRGAPSAPEAVPEVEVTLDVREDWAVPDLAAPLRGAGVTAVTEPVELALDARYLDTPDLRLLRARTTLRRRSGGVDDGWHLKLPGGQVTDRLEVRLPLGEDGAAPPEELARLVRATVRTAPLGAVARVRTRRVVRHLLGAPDADGTPVVLAEVADDTVTAEAPAASAGEPVEVTTWRELEVELVEGDRALLEAAVQALVDAGARRSSSPSKLRRVLGDRLPRPSAPAAEPTLRSRASEVVTARLRAEVERLVGADVGVRRGEPDAVHQMRVATRRLRSLMATWRPLLDPTAAELARGELHWLAGALGQERDAEVRRDHLLAALAAQPPELLPGPVSARLAQVLDQAVAAGHAAVVEALDGDRYLVLLEALATMVARPPLTQAADGRARQVLLPRVAREHRRVADAAEAADGARTPAQREALLHETRKAAKRARYAAEELAGLVGSDARAYAAALSSVQEALGELQDSTLTRELLREVAEQASLAGEDGFGYGRLHALEEVRAQRAEDAFEVAWARADRKRLRRWLR